MAEKIMWSSYEFTVYLHATQWNNVAGIYIFAGLNPQSEWVAYYVGKADSFQNRIPAHEKWDKALSLGATHVHALVVSQEAMRDKIENDLVRAYQPPLNIQLK